MEKDYTRNDGNFDGGPSLQLVFSLAYKAVKRVCLFVGPDYDALGMRSCQVMKL